MAHLHARGARRSCVTHTASVATLFADELTRGAPIVAAAPAAQRATNTP